MSQLAIGELAAGAGVTTSTLRFYEDRGLISAERTSGNQRRYSKALLRRVAFIRTAQQVGLTLDEVAEALASLPRQRTATKVDWARLSRTWRPRLDEQIERLGRLRNTLDGCIGCGCLSLRTWTLRNPHDSALRNRRQPRSTKEGEQRWSRCGSSSSSQSSSPR
jgi:MerR family transcriptional regulator, redox-sensitive transcriptional activator SoxR